MMDEVKDCPFCGRPGQVIVLDTKVKPVSGYCNSCLQDGAEFWPLPFFKWQNRPLEDALRARVVELEEAIKAAADAQEKWRQLWTASHQVDEPPEDVPE